MGITNEVECPVCGKLHTIIGSKDDRKCPKCVKKEKINNKAEWLTERRYDRQGDRPKTLEERIDWLEEWIYEHKEEIERKSICKYI
jgi:uncharacterized protein YydD (DUF2326 family)